jgi:meso-butanediol dehydrogenase / (S,S)-butanediol dehydrogenase / diacetyl reductase
VPPDGARLDRGRSPDGGMLVTLDGRVIVLTGAAGGVGGGIARALAPLGPRLVLADRDAEGARRLADEARAAGGTAEAAELDVTDREAFAALIDGVVARHGRIDQLWNNAGLVQIGSLLDVTPEEWRRVFAVNVEGALFGTQAALRHMLEQPVDPELGVRGKIVNVSSGAAQKGRPMLPAYGASKAALNHLTKTTAAAYGERGICAVIFNPTSVMEGMWKDIDARWGGLEGLPPGEMARRRSSESLRGRFQTPEEVGEVAALVARRPGLDLNGKIVVTDATIQDA